MLIILVFLFTKDKQVQVLFYDQLSLFLKIGYLNINKKNERLFMQVPSLKYKVYLFAHINISRQIFPLVQY